MLSQGSPSISLCSEHPTQHPEHCVQPHSLKQKGLLGLGCAFLLAPPIVLACCFPCPPLGAAPTPRAPCASLFPGCTPWETSSGHEPFPPSTDCICCLRTMIDWLTCPQRAAAESHAPSIYPRSFYYRLKYGAMALHPQLPSESLSSTATGTTPVELG